MKTIFQFFRRLLGGPAAPGSTDSQRYSFIVEVLAIAVLVAAVVVLAVGVATSSFVVVKLLSVVCLVLIALKAYVSIPAYHYGVLERFGRRTGRILYEGPHLILPLIDVVELISLELDRIPIDVTFTAEDRLQLAVSGPLQYRPDPGVMRNDRNVFIEISESTMQEGIREEVQAKLGALGGIHSSKQFIGRRHALGDFITAILTFENPPHLRSHTVEECGNEGCEFIGGSVVANRVLDFYDTHWQWVKKLKEVLRQDRASRSAIENRFGIEIEVFNLASVGFTPETQGALEEQQRATFRASAVRTKIDVAGEIQARLGADAQVALNGADVLLTPGVEKRIISVEGAAGVLGGLLDFTKKGGK